MYELPSSIPSIDIQIQHRNWNTALSESFAILIAAQPGDVVCITGPSRAGKTRLVEELCQLVSGGVTFAESGNMPTVVVEASNTGPNGTFSTKSFMHRMLEVIQHPIYSTANIELDDPMDYQKLIRATEAQLRVALERGLFWRKTKYLIIDEAQHVKYASKGSNAGHAVMDSWKCLAQTTNIVLVVVGAYPILNILRDSPHLLGRKHQVHLPRYHETLDDLEEFGLILAHYDEVVKLGKGIQTLQEFNELLYTWTLGCIGLLRGWLTRASALGALHNEGVTKAILEKTAISENDLVEISKEIDQGEKMINGARVTTSFKKSEKSRAVRKIKSFRRKPKRIKKNNRTERGEL